MDGDPRCGLLQGRRQHRPELPERLERLLLRQDRRHLADSGDAPAGGAVLLLARHAVRLDGRQRGHTDRVLRRERRSADVHDHLRRRPRRGREPQHARLVKRRARLAGRRHGRLDRYAHRLVGPGAGSRLVRGSGLAVQRRDLRLGDEAVGRAHRVDVVDSAGKRPRDRRPLAEPALAGDRPDRPRCREGLLRPRQGRAEPGHGEPSGRRVVDGHRRRRPPVVHVHPVPDRERVQRLLRRIPGLGRLRPARDRDRVAGHAALHVGADLRLPELLRGRGDRRPVPERGRLRVDAGAGVCAAGGPERVHRLQRRDLLLGRASRDRLHRDGRLGAARPGTDRDVPAPVRCADAHLAE